MLGLGQMGAIFEKCLKIKSVEEAEASPGWHAWTLKDLKNLNPWSRKVGMIRVFCLSLKNENTISPKMESN